MKKTKTAYYPTCPESQHEVVVFAKDEEGNPKPIFQGFGDIVTVASGVKAKDGLIDNRVFLNGDYNDLCRQVVLVSTAIGNEAGEVVKERREKAEDK